MDRQAFRTYLISRNTPPDGVEASLALAERFETFLADQQPDAASAWAFSRLLIEADENTEENYIALIRYCYLIRNNDMYIALLELVDGGEVGGNFFRKVAEEFGEALQDEVFAGTGIAPYGTPTPDKPRFLHPALERLQSRIGAQACRDFLSASLRDLPDEYYLEDREMYRQSRNIDDYLVKRKQAFIERLIACQQSGRLFFAQEVTDEVIAFVQDHPEMGGGRREGNLVYETKIPYQAKQYLAENDPVLKRYYYCHCPWAREAIKNTAVHLVADFCYCSGGFHKKAFEIIFDQPLKVDVLASVLRGDDCCRFAIHLPEGVA